MDMDFGTICLLAIFVIVGLMLLSRVMGGMGGNVGPTDFSQEGDEQRTVDNPEVRSRGGFGRNPFNRSSNASSNRSNSGGGGAKTYGGGRSGSDLASGSRPSNSGGGRIDNSEVKSRGGFGRDKGE